MFCCREKLIGLKVIQQNEKSTQRVWALLVSNEQESDSELDIENEV